MVQKEGSFFENWHQGYYLDPESSLTPQDIVNATVFEILKIASSRLNKKREHLNVLDVGCGPGQYSIELSRQVNSVIAVEPFKESFSMAKRNSEKLKNMEVINLPIENTNFTLNSIDLAISLTTVEHMPNARNSMEVILSYLKPNGVLYLTAPNKYWPMECHYHLPFLSWLPLALADRYLQIFGKGNSFKSCSYSRSYWGMKNLFKGLPCKVEFFVPSEEAAYIGCGEKQNVFKSALRKNGIRLIRKFPIFWSISKGFIMVITKIED